VFFGPRPTGDRSQPITHVGIYLGEKRFIHSSGLVKINSFDAASPLYSENLLKRVVRVRRIPSGPARPTPTAAGVPFDALHSRP
jgi:cell wall-associated NlpC family hydrolase